MVDNADMASLREQEILEQRINKARGNTAATVEDSAQYCVDCDEDIPQARRESVPGCNRCIECQEIHDQQQRGYA